MANQGNTGQNYKTSKRVTVEVEGNKVRTTLSCRHSYLSGKDTDTSEDAAEWASIARERIGKRQRCDQCI